MSTQTSRAAARLMITPAVLALFFWMAVPLAMTLYFSFRRYNLLSPGQTGFAGWDNYYYFVRNPAFWSGIFNTMYLVLGVLVITVVLGTLLALLLDQPFWGRGIVRLMVIAPFFVMPTVSGLVWRNMMLNPVNGFFAYLAQVFGFTPFDFLSSAPMQSIIGMVAWRWLPFATLILLTALQSLDQEQLEAAEMDGAGPMARFLHIIVPHLSRAITVVILIQTIFLLSTFAAILVTTNGGPGTASTTLTYLVYAQSLLQFNVGGGAAGGIISVILANIVAVILMKVIGKNLET